MRAARSLLLLLAVWILGGFVACTSPEGQGGPAAEEGLISPRELLAQLEVPEPPLVLDVRTPQEYAAGHVPGAVNIPHTELPARLGELRSRAEGGVVVYCESGGRTQIAQRVLREAGFPRVYHLEGDMARWRRSGLPTELGSG